MISLLSLWRSMPTLWRHGSSSLGSQQLSMSASRHPYSAGRFPSITEGTARPGSTQSFPNCREGQRALAAPAGFKSVLMILCRESLISDYERFAREAPGTKLMLREMIPAAQFRLLEGDNGIDVMCALHLDLTGRPVPAGHPVEGRTYMGRPALPSLLRIQAEVKAASRHPW